MEAQRLKRKDDLDGWHCRGYLPHLHVQTVQFVTFRLADSLPNSLIESWKAELRQLSESARKLELYRRVESYADMGAGSCVLRQEVAARIVESGLLAMHDERIQLLAWVVMPNHVHFVARIIEGNDLDVVVHDLKGACARYINREFGRTGSLWAREYFDRFMRNRDHFDHTVQYVHRNPVKVRLCTTPIEYPFSSSRFLSESSEHVFEESRRVASLRWEQLRAGRRWVELEERAGMKVG